VHILAPVLEARQWHYYQTNDLSHVIDLLIPSRLVPAKSLLLGPEYLACGIKLTSVTYGVL